MQERINALIDDARHSLSKDSPRLATLYMENALVRIPAYRAETAADYAFLDFAPAAPAPRPTGPDVNTMDGLAAHMLALVRQHGADDLVAHQLAYAPVLKERLGSDPMGPVEWESIVIAAANVVAVEDDHEPLRYARTPDGTVDFKAAVLDRDRDQLHFLTGQAVAPWCTVCDNVYDDTCPHHPDHDPSLFSTTNA